MTKFVNRYVLGPTLALVLFPIAELASAEGGKLRGTSGIGMIEGTAGGGLIPWAPIGTYATRDEIGFSIVASEAHVDDYSLRVNGVAIGIHDRFELTFAHQDFYSDALATSIRQTITGAKVRLIGDLVYEDLPVVSLGIQYKTLIDDAVINLVGADDDSGTDLYLSLAKAWINGPLSRTAFVNANLRYSEANETGLLGYGGDDSDSKLHLEAAVGLFVSDSVALGAEYRQKRNHLSAIDEDSWTDVFVAWFPNKSFSVTAAYLDLGEIVAQEDQTGFYLSLHGTF